MKRFPFLSSLCLLAGLSVAHASSFGPLTDGFNISVGSTSLNQLAANGSANLSYSSITGTLGYSDGFSNYTFAEANVPGLVNALSITRVCLTINLGGCSASTVSISDASLLNGTLSLYTAAQVTANLSGSAVASVGLTSPNGTTGLSSVTFVSTSAALGLQSAVVGTQPNTLPVNSPVPEPSGLVLLGTGLAGTAGLLRRRLALLKTKTAA